MSIIRSSYRKRNIDLKVIVNDKVFRFVLSTSKITFHLYYIFVYDDCQVLGILVNPKIQKCFFKDYLSVNLDCNGKNWDISPSTEDFN